MPTEEQIKQIKTFLHKDHIRCGSKGHDWIKFLPHIQEALLCAKCNNILTDVLGGNYVYIYADSTQRTNNLATEACRKMILEGKSLEEIAKELGITQRQVGNLATKVYKRKKEEERVNKIELPKKKYRF